MTLKWWLRSGVRAVIARSAAGRSETGAVAGAAERAAASMARGMFRVKALPQQP